jgi:predicted methyltransferase
VQLKEMAQSLSGIILIQAESVEKLEFFADHYYKLRPTAFAPTLEIDGIRMHRTQNIDPFEDARRKVQWVIKPDDLVLDTCGGLGYTAIWALKLGARKVISIEINPHIIKLRALNPHSRSLFDENIELIVGDALNLINGFKPGQFDSIIHDPPRFSLAGELYSQEFYLRLNKILASSGRLFHYTGEPFSKGRGRKFIAGVLKRLQYSGFEARYIHADRGIFAQKN